MGRKPAWTQLLPFAIVSAIFLAFPFFIGIDEFAKDNRFIRFFYFAFLLFIFGYSIIDMVRLFIGESRENRLLSGDDSAARIKATFEESKLKSSVHVAGRPSKSYHHIRFRYKDEHGNYVIRQSCKIYSPLEVQYLRDLGTFDILVKGRVAVIIESLDEHKMQDYYSQRKAEGHYSSNGYQNDESGRYSSGRDTRYNDNSDNNYY